MAFPHPHLPSDLWIVIDGILKADGEFVSALCAALAIPDYGAATRGCHAKPREDSAWTRLASHGRLVQLQWMYMRGLIFRPTVNTVWVKYVPEIFHGALECDDVRALRWMAVDLGYKVPYRYCHAANRGAEKCMELLLPEGKDVSGEILTEGCEGGHAHIIEWALARGAQLKYERVLTAAENGHVDLADCLMKLVSETPPWFFRKVAIAYLKHGRIDRISKLNGGNGVSLLHDLDDWPCRDALVENMKQGRGPEVLQWMRRNISSVNAPGLVTHCTLNSGVSDCIRAAFEEGSVHNPISLLIEFSVTDVSMYTWCFDRGFSAPIHALQDVASRYERFSADGKRIFILLLSKGAPYDAVRLAPEARRMFGRWCMNDEEFAFLRKDHANLLLEMYRVEQLNINTP